MRCAVADFAPISPAAPFSLPAPHILSSHAFYPESLPCWQDGNLPLHYAVMNHANEMVVTAVFEAHPDGAKDKGQVRISCALSAAR